MYTVFKVSLVIWCISHFRQPSVLKMADGRPKRMKIWGPGVSIQCIQATCTFDSKVFKVSLKSFDEFRIFYSVSQKQLVVEKNKRKFGHRGGKNTVYRGYF